MNEWKVGKRIYKDYVLKIVCNEEENFKQDKGSMPCLKFILLNKGKIRIKLNDREIKLEAPYIICLNDHDQVAIRSDDDYSARSIYFDPSILNNMLNLQNIYMEQDIEAHNAPLAQDKNFFLPFTYRIVTYDGTIPIDEFTLKRLNSKFERLQDELHMERDIFWPCRSRSYFIEMIIMLQDKYMNHNIQEPFVDQANKIKEVETIVDYIHTHYMEKITINNLTREFTMNRNTLSKNFVAIVGVTPIAYLIKHRLKIAAKMLTNTRIPIYEICERVGFGEEANFIRSFKKHYGESPSTYRKQNCIVD